MTTLESIYKANRRNFFDPQIIGMAVADELHQTGLASEYSQRLISGLSLPVYPVVVNEQYFCDAMRDGVVAKMDEIEEIAANLDSEYKEVVEREYGEQLRTDNRGARSSSSQHGAQQVTDQKGARSSSDVHGAKSGSTAYGATGSTTVSDPTTNTAQTDELFTRLGNSSQNNVSAPSKYTTDVHGEERTVVTGSAHTDQTSESSYTDTRSEAAVTDTQNRGAYTDSQTEAAAVDTSRTSTHVDVERKVFTQIELTQLRAKAEAEVYSILRQIIVEATVCARRG